MNLGTQCARMRRNVDRLRGSVRSRMLLVHNNALVTSLKGA
jgi:hypothetical protein